MSESTWDDPRITAYALGELSAEEQAVFESELQSNSELAAAVEEARGVTDQLQGLYANESTPPLDSERRSAIVSGPATNVVRESASTSWRVPALVLAAAAVLLLLVGIAPWLRQQEVTVAQDDKLSQPAGPLQETQATEAQPLSELATATQPLKQQESRAEEVMKPQQAVEKAERELAQNSKLASAANDQQPAAEAAVPAPAMSPSAAQPNEKKVESPGGARGRIASSQMRADDGKAALGKELPDRSNNDLQAMEDAEDFGAQQVFRQQAQAGTQSGSLAPRGTADGGADASAAKSDPNSRRRAKSRNVSEADKGVDEMLSPDAAEFADAAPAAPAPFPAAQALAAGTRGGQQATQLEQELELIESQEQSLERMQSQLKPQLKQVELNEQIALGNQDAGLGMGGRGLGGGGGFAGGSKARVGLGGQSRPAPDNFDAPFDTGVPEGQGPENSGDQFDPITDNPFKRVDEASVSTFSVDVDTASYSKTRDVLMRAGQLPSPDAVRIEELINYFDYDYKAPKPDAEHPFATYVEVTTCPWNNEHKLARIALKGKTMTTGQRPPCNLVFLLDVSGSMDSPNKLPLVVEGMQMLIDQLKKKDRVAIVVYAGSEGLVLDSTSAKNKQEIKAALTRLRAGGSTNGGAGIKLAYQTARDNFISDGVNRVILCTDGDFNVGVTSTADLVRMVEQESKGGIFISVLAFGMGNHNDSMLEQISGRGNGNYAFIDTPNEARKVLVDQTNGTLVTIAKDVKIQIEFNAKHVSQYRLIGYENRILAREDFNDDKKDAGEIGAGHAVTALYELVPAGMQADAAPPKVDPLKYQTTPQPTAAADSDELMTLKLRYKQPDGDKSTLIETVVENKSVAFDKASDDVRFAAAVAGFGMKLRRSRYAGTWTLTEVEQVAKTATGEDDYELRAEFVELVRKASELMGEQ